MERCSVLMHCKLSAETSGSPELRPGSPYSSQNFYGVSSGTVNQILKFTWSCKFSQVAQTV